MLKNDKFNLTLTVCIIVLTTIMIICGLFVYRIAKDTEKNDINKQTTNNFNISNIIGLNTSKLDSIEIASTTEEIERGLMYRKSLCQTCGMLFNFPASQKLSFWMKNTLIPLDMVFVSNGVVKYIGAQIQPCPADPCPSYGPEPKVDIDGVIELASGRAAELRLKVGDRLKIVKYSAKRLK